MKQKITRIQWNEGRRVTIYDTFGVFAILEGEMMNAFNASIARAFAEMPMLLQKENATNANHQVEVEAGRLGEHQAGDISGAPTETGGGDRSLGPTPRS